MPFPQNTGRRIPTTRQTYSVEFTHANGQARNQPENSKVVGSTPEADLDSSITHHKLELDCGCFYPNVEVGGVCAECVIQGLPANICKDHFVVCECGKPCCWKHSRLAADKQRSLCPRCHLREKNADMLKSVRDGMCRIARAIFFKS